MAILINITSHIYKNTVDLAIFVLSHYKDSFKTCDVSRISGRNREIAIIEKRLCENKSHFLAIYGRRRVGKTFLIREYFDRTFDFYASGLANADTATQLSAFHSQLVSHAGSAIIEKKPETWLEAFNNLQTILEHSTSEKKIIFIDELPWLDTPRSGFLSALEYFWNSWASARNDTFLITCGSAASWMIENLLLAKGGLHNRVTQSIKVDPFSLHDTEQFLATKNYNVDRYQLTVLYMAFGGIPFYLEKIDNQLSVAQNIEKICFSERSTMKDEYHLLFRSLFNSPEKHMRIIDALSQSKSGLSRTELIKKTGIKTGGTMTNILKELELSSFIRSYRQYGNKTKEKTYQLLDSFTLFYHKHMKDKVESSNTWINSINTPSFYSWAGNAFEIVMLLHINQIKQKLGISGVHTEISSFQNKNAQIDLVIDRKDGVINLIEAKFSIDAFEINKSYDKVLRRKMSEFMNDSKTKKSIWMTMVTTYGLKNNQYAGNIQQVLSLDDFFLPDLDV